MKRSTGHTHTTAEHTTAEQTTHTNTKRATAQRRLIVEVVVAALKIVVVRFVAERRPLALGRRGVASHAFGERKKEVAFGSCVPTWPAALASACSHLSFFVFDVSTARRACRDA